MKESTNRTLITNPKNIICIGLNYADHIEEFLSHPVCYA